MLLLKGPIRFISFNWVMGLIALANTGVTRPSGGLTAGYDHSIDLVQLSHYTNTKVSLAISLLRFGLFDILMTLVLAFALLTITLSG